MKLLFQSPGHHKLIHSIQQMCASVGWQCEFMTNDARLQTADYDIVVLNSKYIPPERIPLRAKIIYGPQHWVFPQGPLVGPLRTEMSDRAVYNSLSKWVFDLYEETAGPLIVPKACLPFAVDVDRFCPTGAPRTLECMVYVKRRHPSTVSAVLEFLRARGVTAPAIYTYGSYKEPQYLADLQRARYMVVLDAHESQGFALEEAMACDVPLFVLDTTSMYDEVDAHGNPTYASMRPKRLTATSVPYWSDTCGKRITDLAELPAAFEEFTAKVAAGEYKPRDYVLAELSPAVCMRRILDYFHLSSA